MTAAPRPRSHARPVLWSGTPARLPMLDRLAHVALDAFGVLCLIGIGALLGVAVFAGYLAQSGVMR